MAGRHSARARRRTHLVTGVVAPLVTWLLGAVGLIVGAWLVFSLVTGAQIVVFKTGSMSPTMPTGSAAISLPVSAADIAVGDVVTVPRPADGLPVTHRVVSVNGAGGTSSSGRSNDAVRTLTLQGDANTEPDAHTYKVTHALRVLWAVPGLGPTLRFVKTPAVMGILTVLVAGVIVLAFWPRTDEGSDAESDTESDVGNAGGVARATGVDGSRSALDHAGGRAL